MPSRQGIQLIRKGCYLLEPLQTYLMRAPAIAPRQGIRYCLLWFLLNGASADVSSESVGHAPSARMLLISEGVLLVWAFAHMCSGRGGDAKAARSTLTK